MQKLRHKEYRNIYGKMSKRIHKKYKDGPWLWLSGKAVASNT